MKKNIIYIAAMAMLTAACSNEDDTFLSGFENNGTGNTKMITETITATSGDGATRAAIDANAKFTWSAGDQIAVHVSDGKYYTTEALTTGGNNTADFTVAVPEGELRDAFAVYPASIVAESAANYGQSGKALDVTLPGSYAIDEVSGTTTPCPMIADNTGSSWTFKQLCGMLRLVVKNIPTSATYLKIDFDGKKVQGAFSIASTVTAGTSTIATSATTSDDDIITITGLTGASRNYNINLPLPTGNYTNVTVTAYNSNDLLLLTITRPLKTSGTYTAARAKGHKVAAVLPAFSVSETLQVAFAPGNLQATTTDCHNWTWHFAANQWDYIGGNRSTGSLPETGNNHIDGNGYLTSPGTVDLFGWVGKSNNQWGGVLGSGEDAAKHGITVSSRTNSMAGYGNSIYEPLKSDWGNTINDGYSWHTPRKNHWVYVFNTRTSGSTVNGISNARYTLATINTDGTSVNGVILFPDGVAIAVSEATSWGNINNKTTWDECTKCTTAQWTNLAAKGCVFLPAGGYRSYTSVIDPGTYGFYWSYSPYDNENLSTAVYYSYDVAFYPNNMDPASHKNRDHGCSVRLIRDL
ncbi:hypothetical protein SAMN02910409_1136 [Prevotellaceae bacterium HUN156]|nr:hypothetical protein SAMN02910409_1136 [Prevotellaceae bacterium HUN156]